MPLEGGAACKGRCTCRLQYPTHRGQFLLQRQSRHRMAAKKLTAVLACSWGHRNPDGCCCLCVATDLRSQTCHVIDTRGSWRQCHNQGSCGHNTRNTVNIPGCKQERLSLFCHCHRIAYFFHKPLANTMHISGSACASTAGAAAAAAGLSSRGPRASAAVGNFSRLFL